MLTKEQISKEVESAGHSLVDSTNYKNLDSFIEVECGKGHRYTTTVSKLRKTVVCPKCTREIVNLEKKLSKTKAHRVVSIDQATNVAGVAVFDDGELVYVGQRNFYGDLGTRYKDFASFLVNEVIKEWEPDEIIFEDIQYQNNVVTFKTLAGLLGICTLLSETASLPYSIYFNKVWQSAFYIKGKDRASQKRNTIKKVEELFGISVNDDIADSVLLGYYHILETGKVLF